MENAIAATETVMIPLNKLRKSELNVRKVRVAGEYRKQLKASILAQGLLKNLIVAPSGKKGDVYEVGGGGNRLEILQELVAEKAIKADYLVPCVIKSRDELVELSLSENIHAQMHPADEFVAYKELAEQGKSAKEIARRFGKSEKSVKKLLKLGAVAPEIVEAFRAGKMDLDCVMAFTVSDDHERQIACWKEVSKGYRSAHGIRSFLLENALSTDDEIVKYVGLERYRKAGGAVAADLFESVSYVLDRGLLERLANEALQAASEPLRGEGWKWIETSFDGHSGANQHSRIQAELGPVPDELQAAIEEKGKALEALQDKDWDELTEEEEAKIEQLNEDVEALEERRDGYRVFTAEQKAMSGCIVTFDHKGVLLVLRGLVKKEDRKQAAQGSKQSGFQGAYAGDNSDSSDNADLSQALRADLNTYYAQAFQAELMNHDGLAYDLLAYSLACAVLADEFYPGEGLSLSCRAEAHRGIGVEDSAAAKAIEARRAELPMQWCEQETEVARFAAFRELSKKHIAQIVAYCVARMATARPGGDEESPVSLLVKLTGFALGKYWQPTAENYFSRIKKDELIAIGEQAGIADFRKKYGSAKKGELAAAMPTFPELSGWLPEYFKQ